MSLIATLEFHLEEEALHAHFARLAWRIERDDPVRWVEILRRLESSLTGYAERVAVVRERLEAEAIGADHGS